MAKPIIDWDHYRSFLAVLGEGSLSAAARSLGLTQPTIGRHIDQLEQSAGVALFIRSQQGLLPTETARAMAPYAKDMAATAAALMRTASGETTTPSGRVRISCAEIVAVEILPPIIADLQERYPALTVEVSASDDVEDLTRQAADVAVRMTAPAQTALISRKIGAIPLGLYAHRRYLDRHPAPQSLAELEEHRLIGFDRPLPYIRSALKKYPELETIRFDFRADSNLVQLAMIRAGGGIGVCQKALARRDPDLVAILPGSLDMTIDTFVVMHENVRTMPRCRVTFDALVDGLISYHAKGLGTD